MLAWGKRTPFPRTEAELAESQLLIFTEPKKIQMPGGDTLHKESLMVEMIMGASDSLGKYHLSFQTGFFFFRLMTCLRENKADPHPTYENQHSPSLLQTMLSSS